MGFSLSLLGWDCGAESSPPSSSHLCLTFYLLSLSSFRNVKKRVESVVGFIEGGERIGG